MRAVSGLNLSGIASIVDALPKYNFLSDIVSDDFSVADVEELYENGEITQEDINEEISEIVSQKQFSPKAESNASDNILRIPAFCNPATASNIPKKNNILGVSMR